LSKCCVRGAEYEGGKYCSKWAERPSESDEPRSIVITDYDEQRANTFMS